MRLREARACGTDKALLNSIVMFLTASLEKGS